MYAASHGHAAQNSFGTESIAGNRFAETLLTEIEPRRRGNRLLQSTVGPAAIRLAGPSTIPYDPYWWAGARSDLFPLYIVSSIKLAFALGRVDALAIANPLDGGFATAI
jgi:hypothetical protein